MRIFGHSFCRDCGHWTPVTSCESGAVMLHYQLCMRSAWKFCIYSVGKKFYPLTSHWKSLEQSSYLESNTIQCKGNELCPYEYAAVLCYTYIVYLFFSVIDANIFHKHTSVYSSLCSFLHPSAVSVTLGPGILHSKCSLTPSVCVFPLGEGITFFTHVRQWAKSWYCGLFNWCVFWYVVRTYTSSSEGLCLDECYGLQSLVMFFMVFKCFPQNYCHWCRSEADVFKQLWPALMHSALFFDTWDIQHLGTWLVCGSFYG